ncbi:hypothetical protein QUB70_04075 [Microcoleus sp. A003_D6]
MPIPQKVFFLWNGPESPFQNLIKRTFARGLFYVNRIAKNLVADFASILKGIKHKSQAKINIPRIGKNIAPTEGSTNQANKENIPILPVVHSQRIKNARTILFKVMLILMEQPKG